MNILVTGGAGFIGSNIVDELIARGHRVVIIDNLSTGRRDNLNKEAAFHEMDVRNPEIDKVFESHRLDAIVHLAAQIDVRKSVEDPSFDADINILGGINLLRAAKKFKVKKIVYSSTGGAIYGEPRYLPADEKHPIRPMAGYGVSKYALEHYIELFSDLYGIDYTILRYANVYGPRQDPLGEAGVIAIFTGKMLEGKSPVIFGNGEQTRDFVYVSDVVKANVIALEKGSRDIFNIGTGEETSVNTVFNELRKVLGSSGEATYQAARPGEVFRVYLDNRKALERLGWKPEVGLYEGLKRTVEFTGAQSGEARSMPS
ncbi:MAG: SDR family oxidoreductase [Candidatus Eremiobacteraeota bacterium]|nr:SDR family oxidoreductase [Candidatus Eremiobacteraeota bacterium]